MTGRDLLVVGGGPAGLAVALGAARAGLSVTVCEKRGGDGDKACGEGLMPGAVAALRRLGVDPAGSPIRGITYRDAGHRVTARFPGGEGRGVRRTVLQRALQDAADAAGVQRLERAVDDIHQDDDGVRAAGVRARYLVAADGLHSPLRTALGLTGPAPRGAPRWGQRRHFALDPATGPVADLVEVTWAEHAEAYVTPVGPGVVGVAVLSSQRAGFADQLAAFPALQARLVGAEPVSAVRGAGPLGQPVRRRVAGRVLLAGDAAGYVDALTGEGLAVAFSGAEALVDCLLRDRPQDWDRRWAQVSRRSRWLTTGLLRARSTRWLAPRVVPLAARAPRLFTAAVGQLAR